MSKKSFVYVAFLLFPILAEAQSYPVGNYTGIMYSSGSLNSIEKNKTVSGTNLEPGSLYAKRTAEYTAISFIGGFSKVGTEKFNLTPYFNFILGGGTRVDRFELANQSVFNQEDFVIYGILKGGAQFTYVPEYQDSYFGIRMFYWLNWSDGLRSFYDSNITDGTKGDGLAYAVLGGYKNISAEISYAPFFGRNERINFGQIEVIYNSNIVFSELRLLLGGRFEFTQIHNADHPVLAPLTVEVNGNANLYSFFIAFGI